MQAYRTLLRLYPDDVRFAYGDEMVSDFDRRCADARQRGWPALAVFIARRVLLLVCGAAAERMAPQPTRRSSKNLEGCENSMRRASGLLQQANPNDLVALQTMISAASGGRSATADTLVTADAGK
jgi:hypothetical protein